MSSSPFLSAPRKNREGGKGLGMKTKKSRERNRRLRRSIWWWRGRGKEKEGGGGGHTDRKEEGGIRHILLTSPPTPRFKKRGGSGQLTNSPKSQEERKKISCLLFQRQGKRGK